MTPALDQALASEEERAVRDQFRDRDARPMVEVELRIGNEPPPGGTDLRARVLELLDAIDELAPVTISELVADHLGAPQSSRLLAAELAIRASVSGGHRLHHQLTRVGYEYTSPDRREIAGPPREPARRRAVNRENWLVRAWRRLFEGLR